MCLSPSVLIPGTSLCPSSSTWPTPGSSREDLPSRSAESHPGVKRLAQPGMNFGSREKRRMANVQNKTKTACSANLWCRDAGMLVTLSSDWCPQGSPHLLWRKLRPVHPFMLKEAQSERGCPRVQVIYICPGSPKASIIIKEN